ncbi:hypothetical protein ASG97_07195 [Bacillus sp. Soil745]|nr:hypothetical protein ASG97_07195 [Bacillus sp. Soil745]
MNKILPCKISFKDNNSKESPCKKGTIVFYCWASDFRQTRTIMIDIISLIAIGFLIYGPVMLIGLQALDLVPKKAAGTAAGLTGLFGYLGGSVAANAIM